MPNADRPIVSFLKTQNNLTTNKTTSRSSGNSYLQVQEHTLQKPKKFKLRHLNVNFLSNIIEAVEELMQNNIDISLFPKTKLDKSFSNQQLKFKGY